MSQEIRIPYGRSFLSLHEGETTGLRAVLRPRELPERDTSEEGQRLLVKEALDSPIGSPRLSELARGKERILVITSDHTRPVPSRITMPLLLEELRLGNPVAHITILVACGMHRPTTREELVARFGEEIVEQEEIAIHEAKKMEEMAFFGTLPSGGELWLNRRVEEADLVVAEGFIEPHFFAGFSGGRKAILPGVASARTVVYNHNAEFIASPAARTGRLEGNPIHRDMLFAARQAGLAFILNVLLDGEKAIFSAVAGDPEEAHREGCRRSAAQNRVTPVEGDIVITSNGGYPLDQNVYQSVKGMTAAEACVRPGGVIILCAALGDGHGGESFYRTFAEASSPEDVLQKISSVPRNQTAFDQWEAQILARVMTRARVIYVSGEENRSLLEAMHFVFAPELPSALEKARDLLRDSVPQPELVVIPDGVGVICAGEDNV